MTLPGLTFFTPVSLSVILTKLGFRLRSAKMMQSYNIYI